MKLLRYLQWLLILLVGVPSALIITYLAELFLGYYPGFPGWKVGEIAAMKNDVSICENIIPLPWPQLLGPTTSDNQITCIHEYASLTKDPSACELLMPSSYGLSCVGAATKNKPCRFDDQKNVIWNDGEYHEVPYEQCSKGTGSEMGNMCCKAAAAKFDPNFIEGCSEFKSYNPLLADYCQYEVSRKVLSPSLCDRIEDSNLQAACFLEVQTLKDNPDLRGAYPFITQ